MGTTALLNVNCCKSDIVSTPTSDLIIVSEPMEARSHSLRKERCRFDDHLFSWCSEPFKCTYCHLTRKYGLNCHNCDTYQCFDCDTNNEFSFNTHYCPNKHLLTNCKELKECNRCLLYCDGYECIACKYFICTSKICRRFNSTSVKVLPSLKGIISSFIGHTKSVNLIILFANTQLISCSDDTTIKVWDINNFQCIKTLLGHDAEVINVVELDSEKILSSSSDKVIKVWNVFDGSCTKTMKLTVNPSCILRFINNQIIGCCESFIYFWKVDNLNVMKELYPHKNEIINTENIL